jgi:superfamily II DNA/RNA helicase
MKIISYLPKKRQTLMFSATMAPKIRSLASKILSNPKEINISMSKPAEGVLQAVYLCYDRQKADLIHHLIADKPEYNSILIFCSTKKKVTELARVLKKSKLSVEYISSDLEQTEREKVLQGFKARRTRILVATDVLSRGIDIKEINLIINYDVPHDAEDYVHRVGRTARADATGVALTLVNDKDMGKFRQIERMIEKEIIKLSLPEKMGQGPEWKESKPRDATIRRRYKNRKKEAGSRNKNKRNP